MANRGTSPTHGASAVAPALTLFSAGGSGSTGTAAKTTSRTGASVGGRGPLDDNVMVAVGRTQLGASRTLLGARTLGPKTRLNSEP